MATLSLKKPSTRVLVKKPGGPELDKHAVIKARREKCDMAQQWLCQEYPIVFNLFKPLPLAIRSGPVIIKARPAGIGAKTMVRTLNRWTRRPAYQNAIATGDFRYHPDGRPAEAISNAHRQHARELLEK